MPKALKGNALFGQSGGPSMVINASLVGALQEAAQHSAIERFYGAKHGLRGIVFEQLIDLSRESKKTLEGVRNTPSAALGSIRRKPSEADLQRTLDVCEAHNIRYFFYCGGDDSQLACHMMAQAAKQRQYEMRIMGVPKTIDNNLVVTDTCPGYGSAARFVASWTVFAGCDNLAMGDVLILEIMGRSEGWLTAASALARREPDDPPHLIYMPEKKVPRQQFLADVKRKMTELGKRCVIAASEGMEFEGEGPITVSETKDAFGHVQLGGVAMVLSQILENEFQYKVRWDKPGTAHRCFQYCVSQVDQDQAYAAGAAAVKHAIQGVSEKMVTLVRKKGKKFAWTTGLTPLQSVAGKSKAMPESMIASEGNDVTSRFVEYALPLVTGPKEAYSPKLFVPTRFKEYPVKPKLPPYEDKK
jgi:6-phosphofructokinase 1